MHDIIKNHGIYFKGALKLFSSLILLISLIACSDPQQIENPRSPVIFESGDECHVCGMLITKLPGPKGQAFDKRSPRIRKFCSTFDLISWYLQPENQANVAEIYVHDMADTDWDNPDDTQLISARSAFFVVGSKRKSSMGKSIASFAKQQDAELFIQQWGGHIRSLEQLTIESIF